MRGWAEGGATPACGGCLWGGPGDSGHQQQASSVLQEPASRAAGAAEQQRGQAAHRSVDKGECAERGPKLHAVQQQVLQVCGQELHLAQPLPAPRQAGQIVRLAAAVPAAPRRLCGRQVGQELGAEGAARQRSGSCGC